MNTGKTLFAEDRTFALAKSGAMAATVAYARATLRRTIPHHGLRPIDLSGERGRGIYDRVVALVKFDKAAGHHVFWIFRHPCG